MTMDDDQRRRFRIRRGQGRPGCGCGSGCGSFLVVLLLGGALSLVDVAFGIGVSVRIPATQSNLTAAGSIGTKDKVVDALPSYTDGRLADNQNLINHTTTLTIGPAEGAGLFVIGRLEGAPAIDIHIAVR